MGRKPLPKRNKKTRITISISPAIAKRFEELVKHSGITQSEYLENVLRTLLFNDASYARLMMKQTRLDLARWEFAYKVAQERDKERQERLRGGI